MFGPFLGWPAIIWAVGPFNCLWVHEDPACHCACCPCAVGDTSRPRGGRAGPNLSLRVSRGTPRHIVLAAGVLVRRRWGEFFTF